ncbi:MAG: allophanate hydrolase [Proteobacteria bacterium]|nr:allophanate hydrolase [Pseudomonadota bacterium]
MADISPTTLRNAYRNGDLLPSDVIAHVLSRLKDVDQAGVWISTIGPGRAMSAARTLDTKISEIDMLPLYGVIFSVKDCIDVAGVPTTAACPEFAYTPHDSSPVVKRALAAGALFVGKTNLDQFCTGLVGVRSPYGVPRNPHNPDYITGGSSSGAAVSVATGTSSFALGTDTGGSGRVPASYCGITGLKPAPGALSRRGMIYACRSFDTISVYARAPEDAFHVLEELAAFDPEDGLSDPNYAIDRIAPSAASAYHCRLAVPQPSDLRFFGNKEVEDLFHKVLGSVRTRFHHVDEVDFSAFTAINDLMFFGPFLAERDASVGSFLTQHPDAGLPLIRRMILDSRRFSAADAYRAQYLVADTKARLRPFWARYDALFLPTVGTVLTLKQVADDPLTPNFNNGYYTNFANPLGLAAVSVPSAVTVAGVPHGVTFVAPAGGERLLTSLAAAFLARSDLK